MERTLGDQAKGFYQGNGQLRDCVARSWTVGAIRGSEEILSSSMGSKGDGGRIIFSDLQHFLNIILQ